MGSARVMNSKPAMDKTDKKTIKEIIKSLLHIKGKSKVDKKDARDTKEKDKLVKTEESVQKKETKPSQNVNPLASILENFQKLELQDTNIGTQEHGDESNNFTVKVIKDHKPERNNSQSSEDSGFMETKEVVNTDKYVNIDKAEKFDKVEKKTEKQDKVKKLDTAEKSNKVDETDKTENVDKTEEVIEGLEKLELDDDKKKKKKCQTVMVSRAPMRNRVCQYSSPTNPYPTQEAENYREIHQINKRTLTGGQVIVNQQLEDNLTEVDIALQHVENQSQVNSRTNPELDFEDLLEYINEDTQNFAQVPEFQQIPDHIAQVPISQQIPDPFAQVPISQQIPDHLAQVPESQQIPDHFAQVPESQQILGHFAQGPESQQILDHFAQVPESQQIPDQDAFLKNLLKQTLRDDFTETQLNMFNVDNDHNVSNGSGNRDYIYPTPPPNDNDNMSSPNSSPSSFYPSNYEYNLSPELSPPVYNSDQEVYQDIPHFDEEKAKKTMSPMAMKQFKDMQKEILYNLSKKECCQINRKSCKEIFQEHMEKLTENERKSLCFKVAKMDLKNAFGVLHNILLSFSRGNDQEDVQCSLFGLVCGRILTEDASLFAGDAGLSVLKSAALRCPHRALFTRYLVQCVRAALRADPALARDKHAIFHETDLLGDHLVLAMARAGDRCAAALAELVRPEPGQPPLFNTHHVNADGYTALHVACSQHSAAAPSLHTVHVLLEHAGADLWKGDVKGGDSAVHLAVNSATCDLQLIMLMFKHVDRKVWKSLAHYKNMSSVTPIEYARAATNSTTRQNYPHEVLEFLKKCR